MYISLTIFLSRSGIAFYFLSKLRAKKIEKLCNSSYLTASTKDGLPEILKMKYRIPEPGMTISGFADSKKKINADRP
jgi:hypothetical protein